MLGTGKGLLDSLITERGVKSRDLSRVIYYIGVVIEIRRARMQLNFMAIPTSLCAHLCYYDWTISTSILSLDFCHGLLCSLMLYSVS